MTENLDGGPVKCCDACTCENPHRSTPMDVEDNTPEVNVQES